ncbi:hypothetical protein E6H30_08070 [Candidatus Bathyarchaeota archaeon]|nr:MAG: hypothetical protein E6H30_08070 [Candidatus Bathyarchaeota archaeon]
MVQDSMTPLEELSLLISEKGRRILVAQTAVDLKTLQGENSVYILQLPEESHAAGGRAGGFGERRVEKIYCFHYENGACRKLFEVESPEKLERFELPYHAAGTPVILPDGSERVMSGVIDPEFVASYKLVV